MKMTKELRDAIVTELYERCSAGDITIEEREEFIQEATNDFINGADIDMPELQTENTDSDCDKSDDKTDDNKSEDKSDDEKCDKLDDKADDDKCDKSKKKPDDKEKYEIFKNAVEKKCEDGEITEDFRDELLEKAREKFLSDAE